MDKTNGKKTEVWRGIDEECNPDPTGNSDLQLGQDGRDSEDESLGVDSQYRTRQDFPDELGEELTGGILSQLRNLRQAHLAYVKAHEDRLETRLRENREHQDKVTKEMDRLERHIVQLLEDKESE